MLRLVSITWVGLAACGPAPASPTSPVPQPPAVAVPASPAPSASSAPRPPSPHVCDGRDDVIVTAPDVELICRDGHRGCRGTVELTLRNCTAAPVRLLELRVADDGGEGLTTFEPAEGLVAPRASWSHRYQVHRRGDFHVVAKVRGGEGGATTEPAPLRILNPARGEALAACEACNGDWGRHGMLGIEGCNCRTSDAGEPCDDGRDCEGSCLYDHVEIVQTAKPSTCVGGVCRARLATGRPVGTCATHRTTFGCHARIRAGASDQPPSTLPYHVGRICVD